MNTKLKHRMAPLLVCLAGICWGVIGLFSRRLSSLGLNSLQITASRCLVTAVCLLLYLLIADRSKLRIRLRDLWMFLGTGLCSIVFFNVCYFLTIQQVTLSVASVLLYTAPCFVILFSRLLFREPLSLQKAAALVLALAGCILTAGISGFGDGQIGGMSILTGLGSGLGYALYSIFGRFALRRYSPVTVTTYTFLIAAVGILPFCEPSAMTETIAAGGWSGLANVLLLGILCTLLPFALYTKGLQNMDTGKASVIAFVEPMVATLVGIFLFREPMTLQNIGGILLMFCSILLLNLNFKSKNADVSVP